MDTHYSVEQESFRSSLRRFLEDQGGPGYIREHWEDPLPCSADTLRGLTDLGIPGLLVPASAGGMDGNMSDIGVVMEELGRAVFPGACWSSAVGATTAANLFGLDNLLASLADGSKTATLALEEAGQSFPNWANASLSVSADALTGTKIQVPEAASADQFFVTSDNGVYLVPTDAQGLTVEPSECLDGSRRFYTVHFDKVSGKRVGANAELAPAIDRMLVALCADAVGAAGRVLELTIAHASERQQFGQHIGSFQAVQHLCADMLQQLELGRAGLHHALWAQDAGDAAEAHRTAVMCKAFVSETFPQIGANAIQVFGGAGFTWEYDVQLFYKRLLTAQMTWGGSDTWLEELATLVIDQEAPAIVADH